MTKHLSLFKNCFFSEVPAARRRACAVVVIVFLFLLSCQAVVAAADVNNDKNEIDDSLVQAKRHLSRGKTDKAIKTYEKILLSYSGSCEAYRGLVHTTKIKGTADLDTLLKELQDKSDKSPKNDCLLYGLGLVFLDSGEHEESFPYFDAALTINPANLHARNAMGSAFFELKKHSEAEEAFLKVLEYDPEFSMSLKNLRHLYEVTERYDKAQAVMERSIVRTGNNSLRARLKFIKLREYYSYLRGNTGEALKWYLKGLPYILLYLIPLLLASTILTVLYLKTKNLALTEQNKGRTSGLDVFVLTSLIIIIFSLVGASAFFHLLQPTSARYNFSYLFFMFFVEIVFVSVFVTYVLKKRRESLAGIWGSAGAGTIFKGFLKNTFLTYVVLFSLGSMLLFISFIFSADTLLKPHPVFSFISQAPNIQTKYFIAFSAVIVTPIIEELIFRGLLYNIIKEHLGLKKALILSSVIFGLYHVQIILVLYTVVIGYFLARSYEDTKTLTTPVLMHMVINGVSTLPLLFLTG